MRRTDYIYSNRLDLRHRGSIFPTSHDSRGPRTNNDVPLDLRPRGVLVISPKEPSPCPNSGVAKLTPRHPLVPMACIDLEFIAHLPRVIKPLDRVLEKFDTLTEKRTQRKENIWQGKYDLTMASWQMWKISFTSSMSYPTFSS